MSGVVITGIGAVGDFGFGAAALLEAFRSGAPEPAPIDRSQGFHRERGAHLARLVDPVVLGEHLPRGAARRLSPPSKLAVAATGLAVDDAGLTRESFASDLTAVAIGTSLGTSYATRLLDQMAELGPLGAAPMLFIESVSNAPAGQVAVALGARGPNLTVTQHQASGLLALLSGYGYVASGRCQRAVVGTVDEMSPIAHAALDRFRALARAADSGEGLESTRPFAQDRSGFVAAEGASILVLEDESLARGRGARIYGRVVGGVRANDPTASSTSWGTDGAGLAAGLRRGLARIDVTPGSIDRIVSGASGSRPGDALEADVLQHIWVDGLPQVVAPKRTFGEYGGGFLGSLPLALAGHSSCSCLPEVGDGSILPAPAAPRGLGASGGLTPVARILATTLSAGGAAAWVVLDAVP